MITTGVRCVRAAVLGLSLMAFGGSAMAADPTPAEIATARKLIDLKGATKLYDTVLVGIVEKAKTTFLATNPTLSQDLNAVAQQVRVDFQPKVDELKNHVAKLYASHFTPDELDKVYAFYNSPLGEKVISTEPQILDQSMRDAADWANKISDEVIAKMRDEMHKRGHDL